jgi:hypothetical protein
MTQKEAVKLKPGDIVRLKETGSVFLVVSREESGRIVYGQVHKTGPVVPRKNTELRKSR